MSSQSNGATDRERHLDEVIFAYLEAVDTGQDPERDRWLERHPDLADELRLFFTDQDKVKRWTEPLRTVAADDTPKVSGGPPATDTAGRGIADYELLEEIGQGGMGVVYRARQVSLNRPVALKVARITDPDPEPELQRFRNEAEMVAHLDHPHIVPIHEVGAWEGRPYFSMKLIEGGSLAQHLDRYPDRPKEAARLMAAVARAVHHAHQRGILHRDLKPSNILLDAEGRPHVTDFGLARRVETDSGLTQSGALVGTPSYMAPEQTTGQKRAVTTASDVYGLGAVLYALLTGRPPFQADTVLDTLALVREREPQPPSQINRKVDRDLETVCLKCLQKEPERRYGSTEALAEELERWLAGDAILARRPSLGQRVRKWARRHRAAVTAAVVCLLVSLAAVVGSVGWVLGERATRQQMAEAKVLAALEEAGPGLQQGNPDDPVLTSALQRAEAQLGAEVVGPELRRRVEQLRRDQHMLAQLEEARLRIAASTPGSGFDVEGTARLYARAFAEYGLDVTALSKQEAAAFIRASAIYAHLIVGLDDWAFSRNTLKVGDGATQRAVADLADGDPWRRRLREAAGRGDRTLLEGLAKETGARSQPPGYLARLARLLGGVGRWAAAEKLLRTAQAEHPADFRVNFELANSLVLKKPPDLVEATRFYQAAVALRPRNPGAHSNLGITLARRGKLAQAAAAFQKAIEIQPNLPEPHINLGKALMDQGKLVEAVKVYQDTTRRLPNSPKAHFHLANALLAQKDLPGAVAAFRKAIDLKPDYAEAHFNLGTTLAKQRNLPGAVEALRKAVKFKSDYREAYANLGTALQMQGNLPGAVEAFQKAIKLKPDYPLAHYNLGNALYKQGKLPEAVAAYKNAVKYKDDYHEAHYSLGNALNRQGKPLEAAAPYRKAIGLRPGWPEAHCNLGMALVSAEQFAEALPFLRRGHELDSKNPNWPYPSGEWVQDCERLLHLKSKLPLLLSGEEEPADVADRIALAHFCSQHKKCHVAAVRFFAAAFAEQPVLATNPQVSHRYNAARAAALAGCGQGKDDPPPDDAAKAKLRRQALDWLRADLALWAARLDGDKAADRAAVGKTLRRWLEDPDLAGLRDPDAVAKLPPPERDACLQLWADVERTLARAASSGPPSKQPM
jgi:serine/threonine-protein kinase